MSGYVTDKLREDMHSQLVGAFSHVNISHKDIEHMAQHHETDLTSTIIQHGVHKKGVREQSHISSHQNGGFETSKKDNHSSSLNYALARQNINAMQSMVHDDNYAAKISEMGKNIGMDLSQSLAKITHHAQHLISAEEIEVVSAVASNDINESMTYYLDEGIEDALDRAPRNEDGSFMNAEEIKAYEEATQTCSIAGADEITAIHSNGTALNEYYAKLTDPDIRQTLSAIDVPIAVLDELRADRLQTMFDDTYDQRMEAMDKIAEKHGFTAQDGKSSRAVFDEALARGEYDPGEMSGIRTEMLAVNDVFEDQFHAEFDANLEFHAQSALDQQLISINNNGGVFTPPPIVDQKGLETFEQKLTDYSVNNTPLASITVERETAPLITQSGDLNISKAPTQDMPPQTPPAPQNIQNDYAL